MKNQIKLFSICLLTASCIISCSKKNGDVGNLPVEERPNKQNTGVTKGIILKPWTDTDNYYDESDLTLEGYEFPALEVGRYTFTGNNITFKNCKLGSGIRFAGDNVKLEHCEVIGEVVLSGTVTAWIAYNNIHDSPDDGLHITSDNGRASNVTVSNNFIHSFSPVCGAHSDGMQVRGVDKLNIVNNVIDMGAWRQVCGLNVLNAAIFLQDANGGNNNVKIDKNFLNGGGYVLYIGIGPQTRITNNRFGRSEKFGLTNNTSNPGDIAESSGNVRDDTGEPLNIK